MKNIKRIYLIHLISIICILSCDTENDVILPTEQFDYITFETDEINVIESDSGKISTTFIYSGELLSQDLTVNYTITFPDEDAAQEGVDFILPTESGSFILPAGESSINVTLLESLINDELSIGSRQLIFSLQPIEGLILGEPDNLEHKSITLTIGEDDLFEFGYTSFEEVPTFDVLTTYPRPATSVDPLPNIQDSDPVSDAPYVSLSNAMNELGFTTSFTAGDVSSVEQERMGVYNNTVAAANPDEFITTFIDGEQAYITSDLDGTLTLTFDEITTLNPEVTNAVLDVKVFFNATTWESTDGIAIFFETEDGRGEPILSLFSDDIEEIDGEWNTLRIPIPDDRLAKGRLIITMANSFRLETIILDSVSIKGIQ